MAAMTAPLPPGAPQPAAIKLLCDQGILPPLLNVAGLSQAQLAAQAANVFDAYCVHPAKVSTILNHAGERVRFYDEQVEHAFQTAGTGSRRGWAKDYWVETRVARAHWIVPIVSGHIDGTKCYHVIDHASPDRPQPEQLLYVMRKEQYVIYLNRKSDGWHFKTAFVARGADIDRYTGPVTRNGKTYPAPALIWSR